MNPYQVETRGPNVLMLRFEDIWAGWEQWFLLTSDQHHDNIYCRRDLEARHLKEAKEREALIFSFGDTFCAMQGKYDPRSDMDQIRPEDVCVDYLDSIVRHAADDYGSYISNFLLFSKGNHETSILKRHHTDLISNLVFQLNNKHGGQIYTGGYGGWIKLMFKFQKTVNKSFNIKYHHGAGGGGPVTRGVIQTNRQAVYLPDADVVVNGHTHDTFYVPIARERISTRGMLSKDIQHHIRIPGYKDEYADGSKGHAVEKWLPPKPLGSWWLRFYLHCEEIKLEVTQTVE